MPAAPAAPSSAAPQTSCFPGLRAASTPPAPTSPTEAPPRILVIGFGNPGRRDDGLGPTLAARLAARELPGVTIESDYQLCLEHAELVARHESVLFVDAAIEVPGNAPFHLGPLQPLDQVSCFSHQLSPHAVLHVAAQCFGARPSAWLLGVRAADVGSFAEGLTPAAERNLTAALDAALAWLASATTAAQSSSRP
jgi:hydrogenase maturation protease